jgi:hypothetical protein
LFYCIITTVSDSLRLYTKNVFWEVCSDYLRTETTTRSGDSHHLENTFFLWHARISYFVGPRWWAWPTCISNLLHRSPQSWKGFDGINDTQSESSSFHAPGSCRVHVDHSLCYSEGCFSSNLEGMLSELIMNYPQRACFCFFFFCFFFFFFFLIN